MKLQDYETMLIFNADVPTSELKKKQDKYISLLKKHKATIVHQEKPKSHRLAYPIKKQSVGIYQTIEFQGPPLLIAELEKQYNLDETLLRFLTIRLDKHAVLYNQKSREKKAEESKKKIEKENAKD